MANLVIGIFGDGFHVVVEHAAEISTQTNGFFVEGSASQAQIKDNQRSSGKEH